MTGRFPFSPYPNGWFQVALTKDLKSGGVLRLKYFGRELVLFRTDDGTAAVLDAICPHLGANLGVGGKVVSNTLRCPFHGWRFNAEGRCVEIPYAPKIPPAAQTKAFSVDERNGMIFIFHNGGQDPPTWSVPAFPEYGDPEWTPYQSRKWRIRTCPQEVLENTVDGPHLHYVHGLLTVPESEVKVEGLVLNAIHRYSMATPRGPVPMVLQSSMYGLGFQCVRISGFSEVLIVMSITPCDAEYVDLRLSFSVRATGEAGEGRQMGEILSASIAKELEEDIPIWENKGYHERPVLCAGDAPIARFRRWASQFYPEAVTIEGQIG